MKKYSLVVFSFVLLLASACATHRTCPTYTKEVKKSASVAKI
ncbi:MULTISPECIES: hypothetical protein [Sporocytophaga]|nr:MULTISPECIES: hypothetical protein [Sporocytophaga]